MSTDIIKNTIGRLFCKKEPDQYQPGQYVYVWDVPCVVVRYVEGAVTVRPVFAEMNWDMQQITAAPNIVRKMTTDEAEEIEEELADYVVRRGII